MKMRFPLTLLLGSIVALAGCDPDVRMSERGFRLPDGDAEAGREAFVYMHCHQCHTVEGEEFPEVPGQDSPYVALGGKVGQVKTYGQLVTAIINPSHKLSPRYVEEEVSDDGESKMYIYNEHMTVQELADIVMFLQPKYDVIVPQYRFRVYPIT